MKISGKSVSLGGGMPIQTLPKRVYLSVACGWNQNQLVYSDLQTEWTPVHQVGCLLPEQMDRHLAHLFSNLRAESKPVHVRSDLGAGGINARGMIATSKTDKTRSTDGLGMGQQEAFAHINGMEFSEQDLGHM